MNEFVKPLLPEEVSEPSLLEQERQEEAQRRTRQSLAGMQGAARTAEAAGLMQKPAIPVVKKPEIPKQLHAPAVPKTAAKPNPALTPKPKLKPAPSIKKKDTAPHEKQMLEMSAKASPPPIVDPDRVMRQEALVETIASMQSGPDESVFANVFDLYTKAPDKETEAAATVMTATFLRASAKSRMPLLKALAPAMRTWRGSKLVTLLAAKLGKVVAAKPPAPPAPPPGG